MEADVAGTRSDYRERGYVALPGLFAPEEVRALHDRMRSDLDLGEGSDFAVRGRLYDQEAIGVYSGRYPPLLAFLWKLTPRMEEVVGCKLLPTYSYFRRYAEGDICRIHSDRPACEYSLSLTIDYSDGVPWALSVATKPDLQPDRRVCDDFGGAPYGSVAMRPGDAVLYQGVHHRHGRLDPNPNRWSAHLFLHWVDAHGPYREQAFDRPRAAEVQGKRSA